MSIPARRYRAATSRSPRSLREVVGKRQEKDPDGASDILRFNVTARDVDLLKAEMRQFWPYLVRHASAHEIGGNNTGALRVKLRRPPLIPKSGDEISAMAMAASRQSSRTRSAGFPIASP